MVQLLLHVTVAAIVLEAINDTVADVWYNGCCMVQWLLCFKQSMVQLLLYGAVGAVVLEAMNGTVAAIWQLPCGRGACQD